MKSLKGIFAGIAFIAVVILLLQIAFIFVAVAYNALAKDYLLLQDITGYFRYVVGIPVFIVTMFIGGYITASVADIQTNIIIWLNGLLVGLLSAAGLIYPTLGHADLTNTGVVIVVLTLMATTLGGLFWKKNNIMLLDA